MNPPVHAWAALFNYRLNRASLGDEALPFLKRTFLMLVSNFTWWINRKDRDGRNLFEGGFLGLDNIGVFDRSAPLPTGGYLEQADGTSWMAFYAQSMLDMALELAVVDPTYEEMAIKFYEHVISIAAAINRTAAEDSLWDEEDGFFYDVLRVPGQFTTRLKVRSIVGLLPLCAVSVYTPEVVHEAAALHGERVQWFNENRPDLLRQPERPGTPGADGRFMLSLLDRRQAAPGAGAHARPERVPRRPRHPVAVARPPGTTRTSSIRAGRSTASGTCRPSPTPGCSAATRTGAARSGRRSTRCIIRALLQMYAYYGDEFRVECPTGSGQYMTLYEVAQELSNRLGAIFLRNHEGRRPVYGGTKKFVDDPQWKDYVLFNEYFHGDNGAGLGASHQTGWTAVIPAMMQLFAQLSPEKILHARRHARRDRARAATTVDAPGPNP